jgi:hypothetical protein
MVYPDGKAVKLNPETTRPANRTGKRIYTDEVTAALRGGWAFFWYKGVGNEVSASSPPR